MEVQVLSRSTVDALSSAMEVRSNASFDIKDLESGLDDATDTGTAPSGRRRLVELLSNKSTARPNCETGLDEAMDNSLRPVRRVSSKVSSRRTVRRPKSPRCWRSLLPM